MEISVSVFFVNFSGTLLSKTWKRGFKYSCRDTMVKDDVCGLVVVGLRTTKASTSLIMAATRQIQKNLIIRKSLSNQDPKNVLITCYDNNNNYSLGVRLLLRNRSLLNRVCVCQGFSTSEQGVTHPSDPTVRTRTDLGLYTVYSLYCML